MEVHTHTHTPRKKITHYLWEFLMLFLAVFCGFLAENRREHIVEKNREKEFVIQLLVDLRGDSSFLISYDIRLEKAIKAHEAFTKLMSGNPPPSNYDILKNFYKLFHTYSPTLVSTTYSQMKSSGTLRLIHNSQTIIALQKYYEEWQQRIFHYNTGISEMYNEYLLPFVIDHFPSTETDPAGDSVIVANPVYLNRNKESDFRLLNIMDIYRQTLFIQIRSVERTITVLNNLITKMKEEYHLK